MDRLTQNELAVKNTLAGLAVRYNPNEAVPILEAALIAAYKKAGLETERAVELFNKKVIMDKEFYGL